jgi:hypothetical protein
MLYAVDAKVAPWQARQAEENAAIRKRNLAAYRSGQVLGKKRAAKRRAAARRRGDYSYG